MIFATRYHAKNNTVFVDHILHHADITAYDVDIPPYTFNVPPLYDISTGGIFVDIQQNIAAFLSAYKRQKGISAAEFAEELELSRSVLQDYLAGRCNPRADTIEHIAKKLNVSPAALVSGGLLSPTEYDLIFVLLDTLDAFHGLSPGRQQEGIDLFIRLLRLMTDDT